MNEGFSKASSRMNRPALPAIHAKTAPVKSRFTLLTEETHMIPRETSLFPSPCVSESTGYAGDSPLDRPVKSRFSLLTE